MFNYFKKAPQQKNTLAALNKSLAVIEFELNGTIIYR